MKLLHISLALTLLCGSAAAAQDFSDDSFGGGGFGAGFGGGIGGGTYGVNLGYSTFGKTIEPTMRLGDLFGLRMPIGMGAHEIEVESGGTTFTGEATLGGVGVMADFYPISEGFRISAGATITSFGADLESDVVTRDGVESQILASVEQRRAINPVLALGYDGHLFGPITWSASAGGIFGEGFDVHARETSGNATQGEIDAAVSDLSKTAGDLTVAPFLQISVGFSF